LRKERRVNLCLGNKKKKDSPVRDTRKKREKLLKTAEKKIGQVKIQQHASPFAKWI